MSNHACVHSLVATGFVCFAVTESEQPAMATRSIL